MKKLINVIHNPNLNNWTEETNEAFSELFGSASGRYAARSESSVKLRAPQFSSSISVPFAAMIHPSNPDSGAYGGMSFVIFPVDNAPSLIGLVIGTQGLSPDEDILGRPGHARKVNAICTWLNHKHGLGRQIAWSKHDPVRTDLDAPENIARNFAPYESVFKRYGKVLYGIYAPTENKAATNDAVKAFLDLMFAERGYFPLSRYVDESNIIQADYFTYLLNRVEEIEVSQQLAKHKYVILEGPPGTGKTRLARRLLRYTYQGNGFTFQFHPNVTYENFIGGLAPVETGGGLGFQFAPKKGILMEAAEKAASYSQPYLLHIDEINRADLAKVLGDAIFLLESDASDNREARLAYNFGPPFGDALRLPSNLHIIGTMNSSDRSIGIIDIAIRRRFAYLKMWPQISVVRAEACQLMVDAFSDLLSIFVEHASDEAFDLVPGHSYFLESDEQNAKQVLKTTLQPLLEEYLTRGYVAGFSEPIRAYLQWLDSL